VGNFWETLDEIRYFRFAIEIMGSKVVGDIQKFKQFNKFKYQGKESHRIFDKTPLDLKRKNTV